MSAALRNLCADKRVIVCCGAGGVGKTSVSCSLAIAAARLGRRVLAVTIDPSKRLAEALGVNQNATKPVRVDPKRLAAAGVEAPGRLDAWMLDPQVVSDSVVNRFAKTPEDAQKLLNNRIYGHVTEMVAGMQEYTAVEAMHDFVTRGDYDLVVLDTPPSRNALHFLEAPNRITKFLDGRVFRFFLPSDSGLIAKATSKITETVFDLAMGKENRVELMTFFGMFSTILRRLSQDAAEMREFFRKPEVSFVVVTSPAQEAVEEAVFFERKTRDELSLNLAGYVLNRSVAFGEKAYPDESYFAGSAVSEPAQQKLRALADLEKEQRTLHRELLVTLAQRIGETGFAEAAPFLSEGVSDVRTLGTLADALLA